MFRLTADQAERICGLGQGEDACRYLANSAGVWECARSSCDMKETVDRQVLAGEMNAKGDRCSGPARLRITRDLEVGMDRFSKDDIVYAYHGATWGCLAERETPVTVESGEYPFIGVPSDAVEKVPFGEEDADVPEDR